MSTEASRRNGSRPWSISVTLLRQELKNDRYGRGELLLARRDRHRWRGGHHGCHAVGPGLGEGNRHALLLDLHGTAQEDVRGLGQLLRLPPGILDGGLPGLAEQLVGLLDAEENTANLVG